VGAVLAVFHRDGLTGPATRVVGLNQACPTTGARIATARGIDGGAVNTLIAAHPTGRFLGFIGEPR
jgi:hypothetical protein